MTVHAEGSGRGVGFRIVLEPGAQRAFEVAARSIMTTEAPCALAARVAAASGATLTGCAVQGFVATVQVNAAYAGLAAISRARAGPPEG